MNTSRADEQTSLLSRLSPEKRALLALKLRDKAKRAGEKQTIPRRETSDPVALSFAQQRLWFLDQLNPGSASYNMPVAVRLRGRLDVAAMEQTLSELVRRHESLRTTFQSSDGQPVQVIAKPEPFKLPVIDLCGLAEDEREAEALRLADEEARRPFDLSAGPLLRVTLLRLSDAEHVALYTMHHIISDSWSVNVMLKEMAALYGAFVEGRPSPFEELPIQYADYTLWQRERVQSAALEAQLDYWRRHLQGAPALLELPTDRPRPAMSSFRGGRESFTIPEGLAESLKSLSQREGCTLFMVLLAAFKVLLHRYSEQSDILVGTPVANRTQRELEGLIGFFANTLVIRTQLFGDQSFRELLRRVREASLGAYAHPDIPLEKLVEELQPERHLNYQPLFQVMFNFLSFEHVTNSKAEPQQSPGLLMSPLGNEVGRAKFDLQLAVSATERGLAGTLEYSSDLFDASRIRRMLDHFQTLLTSLVAAPDQPLSIHLRSIGRQKIGIAIAATFTAEPLEESLAFWMERLRIPCKIQFAPFNQVFQELLEPSSLIASNSDGVNVILLRLRDWIPSHMPFTSELRTQLEADAGEFLLALKSAVSRLSIPFFLGVDASTDAPDHAQLADLLQEIKRFVIAEAETLQAVHCFDLSDLATLYEVKEVYDPYAETVGGIPYTVEFFAALGTALARKIFATRKSPHKVIVLDCDNTLWKGVCGEDGPQAIQLTAPFQALQQFMLEQCDAGMLLCISSKNNEEDVLEVFRQRPEMVLELKHFVSRHINWGAKSESLKKLAAELQLSLDSFIFLDDDPVICAEVRASCPEVLTLQLPENCEEIPAFLSHVWAFDHLRITEEDRRRSELYQQNREREAFLKDAPSLRDFLSGLNLEITVSPAQADQLERVEQLTQRTNQFNATTVRRTLDELSQLLKQERTECWVVEVNDRFGQYGLVGVLIFRCEADVLKVDTFLLSCRALGRNVEAEMLVKLAHLARERGCREVHMPFRRTQKNAPALNFLNSLGVQPIELVGDGCTFPVSVESLISGAIFSSSDSEDRGTTAGNEKKRTLDADPAEGTGSTAASPDASLQYVRDAQERARVLIQAATQCRVAERILELVGAEKRQTRDVQIEPFVAPRTPTEEILAGIWSELLRLDRVGMHDNFFRLGGYSLLATQVVSRVRDAFQIELPLGSLFTEPTVASLAAHIETEWDQARELLAPPIAPVSREGKLPLSFQQQAMLTIDEADLEALFSNESLNMFRALQLQGPLNVAALEATFTELIRRHEPLRTIVTGDGKQLMQVIAPPSIATVPVTDLRDLPASKQMEEVSRLAREESRRGFDLARRQLLRASLLQLTEQEHVLFLTMHHIAGDGWSTGVLLREFSALYNAYASGVAPSLAEPHLQYADYAAWQREWFQGEVLEKLLSYWRRQLEDAPAKLQLPVDRPWSKVRSGRFQTQPFVLSQGLTEKLRELSRREGGTLFTTLMAAFKVLLWQYTGQEDLVVSTATANRNRTETEALVGLFTQPLVLRTDLSGNPSFRQVLRRVRDTALAAYKHQDLPFELLFEALKLDLNSNPAPLTQVCLALQKAPKGALELSGLALKSLNVGERDVASMSDLELELVEFDEVLGGTLVYSADLFDADTIARMSERFVMLLEEIVSDCERQLFEFLPADELAAV